MYIRRNGRTGISFEKILGVVFVTGVFLPIISPETKTIPRIFANGLPGNLDDAIRAGIPTIILSKLILIEN